MLLVLTCRTKLTAEVNIHKLLENWNRETNFRWHRVTVYGDLMKPVENLVTLLGIKIVEEDK